MKHCLICWDNTCARNKNPSKVNDDRGEVTAALKLFGNLLGGNKDVAENCQLLQECLSSFSSVWCPPCCEECCGSLVSVLRLQRRIEEMGVKLQEHMDLLKESLVRSVLSSKNDRKTDGDNLLRVRKIFLKYLNTNSYITETRDDSRSPYPPASLVNSNISQSVSESVSSLSSDDVLQSRLKQLTVEREFEDEDSLEKHQDQSQRLASTNDNSYSVGGSSESLSSDYTPLQLRLKELRGNNNRTIIDNYSLTPLDDSQKRISTKDNESAYLALTIPCSVKLERLPLSNLQSSIKNNIQNPKRGKIQGETRVNVHFSSDEEVTSKNEILRRRSRKRVLYSDSDTDQEQGKSEQKFGEISKSLLEHKRRMMEIAAYINSSEENEVFQDPGSSDSDYQPSDSNSDQSCDTDDDIEQHLKQGERGSQSKNCKGLNVEYRNSRREKEIENFTSSGTVGPCETDAVLSNDSTSASPVGGNSNGDALILCKTQSSAGDEKIYTSRLKRNKVNTVKPSTSFGHDLPSADEEKYSENETYATRLQQKKCPKTKTNSSKSKLNLDCDSQKQSRKKLRGRKTKLPSVFFQLEDNLLLFHHTKIKYSHIDFTCCDCQAKFEGNDYNAFQMLRSHIQESHPISQTDCYPNTATSVSNHCPVCERSLVINANGIQFRKHMSTYHRSIKAVCESCWKPLTSANIESHMWHHKNDEEKAAVRDSGRPYSKKKTKRCRYRSKLVFNNVCKTCGKKFNTTKNLRKHQRRFLQSGCKPAFHCPLCGNRLLSQVSLDIHMARVHAVYTEQSSLESNQPLKCPVCSKIFPLNANTIQTYKMHMRSHTGERPFQCEICGKGFISHSGLATHRYGHKDVKSFQCEFCEKSYQRRNNLRSHQWKHHKDLVPGRDLNPTVLARREELKNINAMGPKLAFSCNHCAKFYFRKSHLSRHVRESHPDLTANSSTTVK